MDGRQAQVWHRGELAHPRFRDGSLFADGQRQGKKRKTRRDELFLERMDDSIPWQTLEDGICPVHPKTGRGRVPTRCPPCCDSTASGSSTT